MKRWLAIWALLMVSPGAAQAQIAREFTGQWAQSARACRSQGDDRPIAIRAREILFYESRCRAVSARRDGAALDVVLSCSGEGEEWRQTDRLTVDGSGRLTRRTARTDGTFTFTYVRCPGRR